MPATAFDQAYSTTKAPLGAVLLAGHPLAQGLVCAYLCNEEGGGPTDSSGRLVGGALTLGSSNAWAPQGVKLNSGGGLEGSLLTAAQLSFPQFTAVYRYADYDLNYNSNQSAFEVAELTGAFRRVWNVSPTGTSQIVYNVYDNAGSAHGNLIGSLTLHATDQIAMTYDGATIAAYLNGARVDTTSWTGTPRNNFGPRVSLGGNFNLTVVYAFYYARVLSVAELQALLVSPYQMFYAPGAARRFSMYCPPAGGTDPFPAGYGVPWRVTQDIQLR